MKPWKERKKELSYCPNSPPLLHQVSILRVDIDQTPTSNPFVITEYAKKLA